MSLTLINIFTYLLTTTTTAAAAAAAIVSSFLLLLVYWLHNDNVSSSGYAVLNSKMIINLLKPSRNFTYHQV
jgi:hypothetical protein